MPNWLTSVLKWAGLALAVIAAAGLVYVEIYLPESGAAATAAEYETTAPILVYWILLGVGLAAAISGFALDWVTPKKAQTP